MGVGSAVGPTRQRGLSLIELCTALAIVAVLAGGALSGWADSRERRLHQAASEQLATDVRLARSLAAAQGQAVRLAIDGRQGCYLLHTGPAQACRCQHDGSSQCEGAAVALRVATVPGEGRITLSTPNSPTASLRFDAVRGTVTPTGTLRLSTADGRAIHVVVNLMGRVRSCSPEGLVSGHVAC